jgi:hypothetical protein
MGLGLSPTEGQTSTQDHDWNFLGHVRPGYNG